MKSTKSIKILLFAMFLIFMFPNGSWAHSKLESSIPAANAVTKESVQELILSFNEKIDPTLSTLSITNDKNEKIDTTEVKVEETELKATLGSPLISGTYTVEWKIVGGDGHPVKGNYTFQVEAPNVEQDQAEEPADNQADNNEAGNGTTNTDQDAPSEEPADTVDSSTNDTTNEEQSQSPAVADESGSGNTLWIALIVVLAAIGGYFAFKQSRKRR